MDVEPVDVIYGVQITRKGGAFERWSGYFYYRLVNFLSDFSQPANMVTSRLMTRRYVDSLLMHKEREIDIGGLWVITGYSQIPVNVTKHSTSETTYTFRRKIGVLVNSITSFSNFPLLLIFYVGLMISASAVFYVCFIFIQWLVISDPVLGWSSIMASIWLLGGIIVVSIGILGIYLAKIFTEVKARPYTIIRKIYGKTNIFQSDD
jgi:putative glycosyltransferase